MIEQKPLGPKSRRLFYQYEFEGGATVTVTVQGDVATEDVLWVLDELASAKRRELERRHAGSDTAAAQGERG